MYVPNLFTNISSPSQGKLGFSEIASEYSDNSLQGRTVRGLNGYYDTLVIWNIDNI